MVPKKPARVDLARKRVNQAIKSFLIKNGGMVVGHPTIRISELELFRHDGVHLSDKGNAVYLNDMQSAMESFSQNISVVFPIPLV